MFDSTDPMQRHLDDASRQATTGCMSAIFNTLFSFFSYTITVPTHILLGQKYLNTLSIIRAAIIGGLFLIAIASIFQRYSILAFVLWLALIVGAFFKRAFSRRMKRQGVYQLGDSWGWPILEVRYFVNTWLARLIHVVVFALLAFLTSFFDPIVAWWLGISAALYAGFTVLSIAAIRQQDLEDEDAAIEASIRAGREGPAAARAAARRDIEELERERTGQDTTPAPSSTVRPAARPNTTRAKRPQRETNYGGLIDSDEEEQK